MAELRRTSWPWRKKAAPKVDKVSSLFSTSQLSNLPATDSSLKFDEEPRTQTITTVGDNKRLVDAETRCKQAEDEIKSLRLELNTAKDEVKQHQKVAEDAISGWEKAEKEAISYKQQLDASQQQKLILEDRVAHLDAALKECMRQVRHVKEEQAAKIEEAILSTTREWEKIKAEVDAKQVELERRLMESDAQNNVMAKSLQERGRKIIESNEAKAKAETEVKLLQVKLGQSEKDISGLKYELHVASKELEIRNEELEYIKKSADAAHKQHLDHVKKMANLEADCQRLRNLLKKKLPGPAAIAQMRKEVEGLPGRDNGMLDMRRRPSNKSFNGGSMYTNSYSSNGREMEMLRERVMSMEEENNLLKEALAKRNGELQASRLLCAKTASKLSVAEDQLESIQGTPRDSRPSNGFDFSVIAVEPSVASVSLSEEESSAKDAEEASCAESWASALISELAHIKKEKPTSNGTAKDSTNIANFNGVEKHADSDAASNGVHKSTSNDPQSTNDPSKLQAIEGANNNKLMREQVPQMEALSSLCKELGSRLCMIEEKLKANKSSNPAEEMLTALVDSAHHKFSQLEKAIQEILSNANHNTTIDDNDNNNNNKTNSASEENDKEATVAAAATTTTTTTTVTTVTSGESDSGVIASSTCLLLMSPPQVSGMESVLSKLMSVVEMLASKQASSVKEPTLEPTTPGEPEGSGSGSNSGSGSGSSDDTEEGSDETYNVTKETFKWDLQKQALVSCKDCFLQGKASLLELLVRLAIVLCQACNCEWNELKQLLQTLQHAADVDADVASADAGYLRFRELASMRSQLEETMTDLDRHVARVAELEAAMADVEKQLADTRHEADARRERAQKLEVDVAELTKSRDAELAEKSDVAAKLEAADVELAKLQSTVASLSVELADQKKLHEEALAKCETLEQKLQSFTARDDCDDTTMRKERELVAAKERLAECQRTIMTLGKQITALSSSPSGSFDTVSMDSDQRPPSADDDHSATPHQQRRTPPQPPRWPQRYDPEARGWRGPPSGAWYVASGPQPQPQQPPENAHHMVPYDSPAQAPRGTPVYRWDGHVSSGAYYPPDEEDVVGPLALTVYSPPDAAAVASPARSPGRYVQQVAGRRDSRAAVRTSLEDSLNAADAEASKSSSEHSGGGGLGRLFRSKKNARY